MLNFFNVEFFDDSSFIVPLMLKCSLTKRKKQHVHLSAVSVSLQHVRLSLHRLTERTCPHPPAERRVLTLRDKR